VTRTPAPTTQQVAVTPGSRLVIDLDPDDELILPVAAAPSDTVETPPSEVGATEGAAPASWYLTPGNGAAATIRVADPAEIAVVEPTEPAVGSGAPEAGTAAPADGLPADTREEPAEVPTDVAGQDGEAVAQDAAEDGAPVSVVVSFVVPTPGVLPAELQAPEWLAPADAVTGDEPAVPAEGTGVAEDSVPVEPSVPSESSAPVDVPAPVESPAPEDAPAPEETPS
jgi:hypothetical protein